ncbi:MULTISPECIES: hypothetical protein [Bacillaceae]|uniref:hypothetical protein n=1 Tax=Bacillaceae TaxID=186817 RepID=UPI000C33B856|nr:MULTISPECIES: hypothetical protein [Bacillaceae]MCK1981991.1 hypothetical protein [Peribacillus sp. Aquil_B1]MCK2007657.1 hypothetical protein [Peribacillus sp. Aquil_B8]PKF89076.1 hypothetical protein CW306_07035 [Bacillus sp. BA3]
MKKRVKISPVFFLLMLMVPTLYLESSYLDSLYNTEPLFIGQESVNESEPAMAESEEQKEEPLLFELDERLINKKVIDGYLVETYREYELYKDKSGKVIKVNPTSNYNYIRYKIYN